MDLGPVQRTTAAQAVADRLLQMIRGGAIEPGARLPNERELAERFGVGRSSVREAMQMLATLRVVEARAGAGTFVRRPQAGQMLGADTLGLLAASTRAMELLEAREMIEPPLARLAALRATEEDLARIEGLLAEHWAAIERAEPVVEHAARFHLLVAEAAHNRIGATFLHSILGLFRARGRKTDGDLDYARIEHGEHAAILAVLRTRDGERAAEAMLEHILRSAATYDLEDQPAAPATKERKA